MLREGKELSVTMFTILICRTKQYFSQSYRFPKNYDPANPRIDRIGLQGDAMTVEVCTDNPNIDEDMQLFLQSLSADDEIIGERLTVLAGILKKMGY